MLSSAFVDLWMRVLAEAQGDQGNPMGGLGQLLFPLLLIMVIFWLLIFLPESRKRKALARMISSLKKGDMVVTQSGILGRVWRVDDHEIVVVVDKDKDVKMRFTKSAVQGVLEGDATSDGGEKTKS